MLGPGKTVAKLGEVVSVSGRKERMIIALARACLELPSIGGRPVDVAGRDKRMTPRNLWSAEWRVSEIPLVVC